MAVMVSISCTTYNQEGYIAQALDSFLMQETDFDFEILVHDDASTDGTAEIVREYERKYPRLIKPLYQTENQYSKGVKIWPLENVRASGKYVALCEGDDYWTDASKLQRQVDLMEGDPTCALSVHSSLKVSPEGARVGEVRPAFSDRAFTTAEIILESPGFFATSSLLFSASVYEDLPEYFFKAPVGDWPLILFLSSRGSVRYIDRHMSAYRTNAVNSWTRSLKANRSMQIEFNRGMSEMFSAFDRSLGFTHADVVRQIVDKHEFRAALLEGNYDAVTLPKYSRFYRELGWRSRFVITLRLHSPGLASLLASAKGAVGAILGRRS